MRARVFIMCTRKHHNMIYNILIYQRTNVVIMCIIFYIHRVSIDVNEIRVNH